jgi:hypothetical protein
MISIIHDKQPFLLLNAIEKNAGNIFGLDFFYTQYVEGAVFSHSCFGKIL